MKQGGVGLSPERLRDELDNESRMMGTNTSEKGSFTHEIVGFRRMMPVIELRKVASATRYRVVGGVDQETETAPICI